MRNWFGNFANCLTSRREARLSEGILLKETPSERERDKVGRAESIDGNLRNAGR